MNVSAIDAKHAWLMSVRYSLSLPGLLCVCSVTHCLHLRADAVEKANDAAIRALSNLCTELRSVHFELSAAVQLGILITALLQHSRAAKAAGWSLPHVGRSEQLAAGVSDGIVGDAGAFTLKGLFPYWMSSQEHSGTVRNDIDLPGLMLLTGPNMSGGCHDMHGLVFETRRRRQSHKSSIACGDL